MTLAVTPSRFTRRPSRGWSLAHLRKTPRRSGSVQAPRRRAVSFFGAGTSCRAGTLLRTPRLRGATDRRRPGGRSSRTSRHRDRPGTSRTYRRVAGGGQDLLKLGESSRRMTGPFGSRGKMPPNLSDDQRRLRRASGVTDAMSGLTIHLAKQHVKERQLLLRGRTDLEHIPLVFNAEEIGDLYILRRRPDVLQLGRFLRRK